MIVTRFGRNSSPYAMQLQFQTNTNNRMSRKPYLHSPIESAYTKEKAHKALVRFKASAQLNWCLTNFRSVMPLKIQSIEISDESGGKYFILRTYFNHFPVISLLILKNNGMKLGIT